MTWNTLGLVWFCIVSLGTPPVLLYDYYLHDTGQTMITVFCRANPWCAFLILTLLLSGVAGLAMHLMGLVEV